MSSLSPVMFRDLVKRTLEEDLGRAGDLTTEAVIPSEARAEAALVARQAGCIAGLEVAREAFLQLDPATDFDAKARDGARVEAGTVLAVLRGSARGILTAERTALNFLGHLSGIATVTARVVDAVAATGARIACTRKTTPLLRALEKYAVRCAGGSNHRFGLDDAVMIKDNHRAVAGGLEAAVEGVRDKVGHLVKIEVEVDTLEQLDRALEVGVDVVLLDNMNVETLREAVRRVRASGSKTITEASGGITPETAPEIAATGVDVLSLGWITHSAPRLDVALDIEVAPT